MVGCVSWHVRVPSKSGRPSRLQQVSVLAPARHRSTWLASSTFGSVQLRPLRAR